MEQGPPKEFLDYLLAMIAAGSPEGAKLAARFAEAGIGVPVSVPVEDMPKELLEIFMSGTQGPVIPTVVDINKKPNE